MKHLVWQHQYPQNEQYLKLITEADGLLSSKEYEKAKLKYQSASDLKSEEQYPKGKIVEIDGLLAELANKEAPKAAPSTADLIPSLCFSYVCKYLISYILKFMRENMSPFMSLWNIRCSNTKYFLFWTSIFTIH